MKNKFRLLGKSTTKAKGEGKIILPSNDSIPNTLLIQRNVWGDIFLSKDSVEPDSQAAKLLLEVETNEWYIYVTTNGDRYKAVHHFDGNIETNEFLKECSIKARKETVKNFAK